MSSGSRTRSSVWPSTNSPGMEDEGLVVRDLDRLGQLLHRLAHVDERVARVVEDPEAAVHPHVDARRLDHRLVERIEDDPPGLDLRLDRAVAEDHAGPSLFAASCERPRPHRRSARDGTADHAWGPSPKASGCPAPIEHPKWQSGRQRNSASGPPSSAGSSRASSRPGWRRPRAGARRPPRLPVVQLGPGLSDRLGAGERPPLARGAALPRVRVERRRQLQPGRRRPPRRGARPRHRVGARRSQRPRPGEHGGPDRPLRLRPRRADQILPEDF